MRILMTGTRDYRDAQAVDAALTQVLGFNELKEPVTIMHLATNVVDGIVAGLAGIRGITVREVAPDWRTNGKSAMYRVVERVIPDADLVVTFGVDAVTEHIATVGAANNVRVLSVKPAPVEPEVLTLSL